MKAAIAKAHFPRVLQKRCRKRSVHGLTNRKQRLPQWISLAIGMQTHPALKRPSD